MKVTLEKNQKERLRNAGLINTTTENQSRRGFTSFFDPVTDSRYLFSPKGYAYRRTDAGQYQLNPRVVLPAAFGGKRSTKATVRTTDAGAQTELVLKGVRSYRSR